MNKTISIKEASSELGMTEQSLRLALQQGKFEEFGIAIKHPKSYSYYINRIRLNNYLKEKQS